MLRRPSLPPLTLPLLTPLPAAVCAAGWEAPCEPWLRSGAWAGRGTALVVGFQLPGALSAADLQGSSQWRQGCVWGTALEQQQQQQQQL